ncbi:polysaccharide deacetylase family protein [Maribacter sp. PR1]|uniref:Polysaccharide deacetylase family protein n=1 Tax=Maribacter cobaltidurans TaxID=1178778 RepID=A0ABU7INU2_9FLAO|nr:MULTISPECIES: polysaccharide deacetylase family protein [Maribacter]MDC6387233.1 polysaccharide deacetylase family protein [Maribacter sp. PR1]MEE1974618.1 polysaccharide deacetylase family protein [Maribacter cobaltidurans]
MLLIYTHKITPRLTYTMKQVFTKILGIEIGFTTKVEDFIKHKEEKITYTKQPLQNEFFIRSHELLFEQGVNDVEINVMSWDNVPCFFFAGERSNLPYDIFAASFYLISRYEEYLPHVKDAHGRFPFRGSLAYEHKFLERPVVDIWAMKLFVVLKERFPSLVQGPRKYKFMSLIDVTTSHCYANRGVIRGAAGFLLDLGTFKLKRLVERIAVGLKIKGDPYDNFATLIEWHKKLNVNSIFFFQFANYSKYDKNVSTNSNNFRSLIKYIGDYSKVALAASYSSFDNVELLKNEKHNLENVVNRPVNYSRMRYNRVDVPETYRNLITAEFTDDFTMGYSHQIGFRAGTCTPFQFYDIPLEVQQPIKIFPFVLHDYSLLEIDKKLELERRMDAIYNEIKLVKGTFISVFSNELLGSQHKFDWKEVYYQLITKYNV